MTSLDLIAQRVDLILFKYLMADEGIICDEGEGNVANGPYIKLKYSYKDTDVNIDEQSKIKMEKLVFLNDVIGLLKDIQVYFQVNGPYETIDEYVNCSEFTCNPGCSCSGSHIAFGGLNWCGKWDDGKIQKIVSEIDSMKLD